MIVLPDEDQLIDHVRASLDAVAERDSEMRDRDWFPSIARELATRVHSLGLTCYARGKPEPCAGAEWLFDFCALIEDQDVLADDRFMAQAAIVGEVEWNWDRGEVDKDFEKLLIADSLVLFMTFQNPTVEAGKKELDRLEAAARRRQQYARLRGLSRPPVFLLSPGHLDRRIRHPPPAPGQVRGSGIVYRGSTGRIG
jgi:hypothetical protein